MAPARKETHIIDAGRHPVVVGAGSLAELQLWLRDEGGEEVYLLGDDHTLSLCAPLLLKHVPALATAARIEVPAGEASKQLEACRGIWEHLARSEASRDAVLVNLGGGVVTDLGGFVAGTFKRGIRTVNVPTTLMGMVDAAIGGKTAIDLEGVKNLVGVYHDPVAVHVHVPFLRTLGKRELLNGLAEMIKHGLIADAAHWKAIQKAPLHDLDALTPLIERSAAIKAAIVKGDPREQHQRKTLNFGHTIGHAVEALSWESPQRALLHGEAVAIGMIAEAWLSWRTGRLDRDALDNIEEHLLGLYRPFTIGDGDHHRLIELMRNDKKNREGGFRFTLLDAPGRAAIDVPVTAAEVKDAVDHYRERVAALPAIPASPEER
jgi:3-dehydroquinate synthase